MEKSQRSAPALETRREPTEQQMGLKACVPGLLALASSSGRGNKHTAFVNRDFTAAIHIRRYVVLRPRPEELRRS